MTPRNHQDSEPEKQAKCLRWKLTLTSTGVIILGTIVTTCLGVFAQPDRLYWPWLWISILFIIMLLGAVIYLRRLDRQQKEAGTLYYIRFLDTAMSDVHESTLHDIRSGYMDLRTVTRSYPPYDEHRDMTDARPAAIDVSSTVAECSHALEQVTASDTVETQFTYAPNALFPLGLSIGYQTYFIGNTTFIELPNTTDRQFGKWHLDKKVGFGDTKIHGTLSWPLEDIPWGLPESMKCNRPIALLWNMTPSKQSLELPQTWGIPSDSQYRLGEGDDCYKIDAKESEKQKENINKFAAACARSLWNIEEECPNSPIVLCARLPKSLQLAIGWRLGQKLDKTGDSRRPWNPWERLITLQYTGIKPWDYCITRVNPAQPTIDQMMTMLGFDL